MRTTSLINGALLVTAGRILAYGCSFLKNLILARALTKADYGLAAAFAMTVSLLEFVSKMGFGTQIIQSKDGDSESFQAAAHAFQIVMGLGSACLVGLLAYPFAEAFGAPQAVWAFACLGLVPLFRSFEHLDNFRQQRQLNYFPVVACEAVPQLLTAVAAWPIAIYFGDYRAIVVLTVASLLVRIFLSHILSERPFLVSWDPAQTRGMLRFGWPLLINGFLIFAAQQADQFLLGSAYGLESLALYSIALSVILIPWEIYSQAATSTMLPVLSRSQDEIGRFTRDYSACVEYAALFATLIVIPLVVGSGHFLSLVFGERYREAGGVMALLGFSVGLRFLRHASAVAAMARADSKNYMYSNLGRAISIPGVVLVISTGGAIELVAVCAIFGEICATAVSLWRLRKIQGVILSSVVKPYVFVVSWMIAGGFLSWWIQREWNLWKLFVSISFCAAMALFTWRVFRSHITTLVTATDGVLKKLCARL